MQTPALFPGGLREAGNISVVVTATDGTTVAVKNVNIIVGSDRASAVQASTSGL